MKTNTWITTLVVCFLTPILFQQCRKPCWRNIQPPEIRRYFNSLDALSHGLTARVCTDSLGNPIERDNLIIHFPASMSEAEIQAIRDEYQPDDIDSCLCDPRLQNWIWGAAREIHIEETVSQLTQDPRREGLGFSAYMNHFVHNTPPLNFQENQDTAFTIPDKEPIPQGGKIIAILDTGIDPALEDRGLLTLYRDDSGACAPKGSTGWNFVDDNNDITDHHGHGTAVAGVIAESLQNAEESGQYGCGASFLILKILGEKGAGNIFDAMCAVQYAINVGAEVINASWGYYNTDNAFFRDSILTLTSPSGRHPVIVTSMGNHGKENINDYRHFPSDYSRTMKYIVAVGGDTRDNIWESVAARTASPAELMDFSNYRRNPGMITGPSNQVSLWGLGLRRKLSFGTSYSAAFLSASAAITQCCHTAMRNSEIRDSFSGISPVEVNTTSLSIDLILMNAVLESGNLCRPPGS